MGGCIRERLERWERLNLKEWIWGCGEELKQTPSRYLVWTLGLVHMLGLVRGIISPKHGRR